MLLWRRLGDLHGAHAAAQAGQCVPAAEQVIATPAPAPGGGTTAGVHSTGPGSVAGAGVGAGAGTSGPTVLLAVAAVVGIAAVGGVAYVQHERSSRSEPSSRTGSTSSVTPSPNAETSSGLAGTWRDGRGDIIRVSASGSGSYAFTVQSTCGTELVHVTRSGDSYTGTGPLYDMGGEACRKAVGRVDFTITLAPTGRPPWPWSRCRTPGFRAGRWCVTRAGHTP
ncbi:hypothetical protein EHYA_00733 [Embleya hyalina]|uniref:Uncharacterized protein n=1 Tax=Embleya hyalina TaxID=516124 RepID=A0A401YES8_9ACTN|nr:hypothetical protein EHYA_00733 [Embleya hyalina]